MSHQWDFFLAHAGADTREAENLYDHLAGRAKVFLDSRRLLLGDDWDLELSRAQRNSMVTVVLVSKSSEHAYYEREEIAEAVARARKDPAKHRVVPVFLDRTAASRDEIPYGLRLKHGVIVEDGDGLAGVANKLLALLESIRDPSEDATGVQEINDSRLSTTAAGFVGPTARGPLHPYLITSWSEYQQIFGEVLCSDISFMGHAVHGFFQNGGGRAYIARVVGKEATSASGRFALDGGHDEVSFEARSPGVWGNNLVVQVRRGTRAGIRITILERVDAAELVRPLEDFDNLLLDAAGPNFVLQVVNEGSKLVFCSGQTLRSTSWPAILAPLAGGTDGAPLGAEDYCGESHLPEQGAGLSGLAKVDEIALLCVPDHVHPALPVPDQEVIATEMTNQCELLQDRFALLSVAGGQADIAAIRPFRDTAFAALYYPWIGITEPVLHRQVWVPSVGHVAGIFARCDLAVGIHRSPEDQEVRGVSHGDKGKAVEFDLRPEAVDTLKRLGVNAICDSGKERGVRVVSALTMSIDTRQHSIGARRFLSFVEKSIRLGTAWARLESNDERLWAKIADDVQAFLKSLWEVGALSGRTPEEAYFVKCDRTTMTWEDIHNGRAIVVIGLNMVQGSDAVPRTLVIQTGPPRG